MKTTFTKIWAGFGLAGIVWMAGLGAVAGAWWYYGTSSPQQSTDPNVVTIDDSTELPGISDIVASSTAPTEDDRTISSSAVKKINKKVKPVGSSQSALPSGSITDSSDDPGSASEPISSVGASFPSDSNSNSDSSSSSNSSSGVGSGVSISTQKIAASLSQCSFSATTTTPSSANNIILNEIAWMGSYGQAGTTTGAALANDEWIELKNLSATTIDLAGWQILDASGKLKIAIASTTEILPGGFYLLMRGTSALSPDSDSPMPDGYYSGALPNTGDNLELLDPNCAVADHLDASGGWPAGDNVTKQTLERDADGVGWHTSATPGGTPGVENSIPLIGSSSALIAPIVSLLGQISSSSMQVSSSATNTADLASYLISVSMSGGGSGTVSTTPIGITCGSDCWENYSAGTKLTFSEAADNGSVFSGWSGGCNSSSTQCTMTVSLSTSVVARFEPLVPPIPQQPSSAGSGQSVPNHLLVAAIQIGAASSSNDFVKIFNPTSAAVDISGWKLHKKSSTGTDYSLRTFGAGTNVSPGGYFTWANSEGGFATAIGADVSSTETLSADNSVALLDTNGAVIDQIAWGTGTSQYVEGSAYPTDPTAGQILTRITGSGGMVDTDDNENDFMIR
jgi:hypothetical protein